jgi:hypothetical protein
MKCYTNRTKEKKKKMSNRFFPFFSLQSGILRLHVLAAGREPPPQRPGFGASHGGFRRGILRSHRGLRRRKCRESGGVFQPHYLAKTGRPCSITDRSRRERERRNTSDKGLSSGQMCLFGDTFDTEIPSKIVILFCSFPPSLVMCCQNSVCVMC